MNEERVQKKKLVIIEGYVSPLTIIPFYTIPFSFSNKYVPMMVPLLVMSELKSVRPRLGLRRPKTGILLKTYPP